MQIKFAWFWLLVIPNLMLAQVSVTTGGPIGGAVGGVAVSGGPMGGGNVMFYKGELGNWWKNSEIVSKLHLTDNQIKQLEDSFYQHRLKLIDYGAETQKQDLKLEQLMHADYPDEKQVTAQVDQLLAARGKLEREFTLMTLDFRKVLSLEQWKQLQAIHTRTQQMFIRRVGPPGSMTAPFPPGVPPPPPSLDLDGPEPPPR
ncbi:MAG TPA: periplasmic heavy metal sensor [Terriglobales bacterium]|nr:periplasmic heavy metal sensor [Terriglobales bacterium]